MANALPYTEIYVRTKFAHNLTYCRVGIGKGSRMITVKHKNLKLAPATLRLLVGAATVTGLVAAAIVFFLGNAPSDGSPLAAALVAQEKQPSLNLVATYGQIQSTLLIVDPSSGVVKQKFQAGYNSSIALSTNQVLYTFSQIFPNQKSTGLLSARDTRSGQGLWQISLANWPFASTRTNGIWLSADEQTLYLLATPDGFHLHLLAVATPSGALRQEFEFTLPYPANTAVPRMWKLPWAEMLVVGDRNQVFTFDLTTGQVSASVNIVNPPSVSRIPRSFPAAYYLMAGVLDAQRRQLILATAPQEIITVDLTTQPFTLKTVYRLPEGWLFGGSNILTLNPSENRVYLLVKRVESPILGGREADAIWTLDRNTWQPVSQLDIKGEIARVTGLAPAKVNLENYGVYLSPDEQRTYFLASNGLLRLAQDSSSKLFGTWLTVQEDLSLILDLEVIPSQGG